MPGIPYDARPAMVRTATPRRHTVTGEQTLMLDFALRWHRFGGARPEDIFLMFGIGQAEFYSRLSAVLARQHARPGSVTEREWRSLQVQCSCARWRLPHKATEQLVRT